MLEGLQIQNLKSLNEKEKIFIYIDSFENAGTAKEEKRDYLNELWNLKSRSLDPLRAFLSPYFITP